MSATTFTIIESESLVDRRRDLDRPIMLVGFQVQGNLGLGYLAATLRQFGYRVEVFDFQRDRKELLAAARQLQPLLIGYSLIFQFYINQFSALMKYLRVNGVTCHFTMGGHFPSLSYESALTLAPELDSIVRFEGELTLLELADFLGTGRDWRTIQGIAFRGASGAVSTPPRALVKDLDQLPFPDRDFKTHHILGRAIMPILASRGCVRTCSFCSIHMFYRSAPGKVVRTRKPAEVVREMRFLNETQGTTVFLFQDDDFPLYGAVWRRWAQEFVDELHHGGLAGRVVWKINCRADAVEADLMQSMRDAGLFLVYMGLESGSEEGLKTLHKQITVEQNIRAVNILKSINLRFEFGFMLLDPSSTFESVRENLRFLRTIVGDGSSAAGFSRMIPYDGTPIKDELERTGRLLGDVCNPSYDFLDRRLQQYYDALTKIVNVAGWVHGIESLSPQLTHAWNEVAVIETLFPPLPGMDEYRGAVREITREANEILFRVMEELADFYTDGKACVWSADLLRACSRRLLGELLKQRNAFVYRHKDTLLEALRESPATRGEVRVTA
jgi:anaerobic magnesium-protoporphyrin IX monomethyl ester cyclase